MSEKLIWHTEKRRVKDLIPYDKNPRILSPKQQEELVKSFKKFNLVELPAIDLDGKIVAGHQRIKIMLLLGRSDEEIDVRAPNRLLTENEFKEYNLRSNANGGGWDLEMLKDVDLNLLLEVGFDDKDLASIWNDVLEIENDNFQIEKELEKIKTTEIKTGDKFRLGSNFLVCGDNSDINIVKQLMGVERADMINFDPQYNIGLNYNRGIGNKGNYGGDINDKKSDAEYKEFLKIMLSNGLAASKDDVHVFCYCDQRYVGLVQNIYTELGIKNLRTCLWIKNGFSPTPQVAFNKCYEPCVYGIKGKPFLSPINNLNEIMNKEIGTGNGTIDDISDEIDIWLVKRLPGQEYEHATSKPPTLHEKAIRRCTKINDIVIDFCAGSGSIAISCEMLKRRCFMIEVIAT